LTILSINNQDYRIFDSFSEITVKKARELYKLSSKAPKELLDLYNEQSKGKELDEEVQKAFIDSLDNVTEELDEFFFKVLKMLSDIPADIINGIVKEDLRSCYNVYLYQFVFGVLYFPIEKREIKDTFEIMQETYCLPENKMVMGFDRPFCDETAGVFCDASDVDNNARQSEGGKYEFAELLTSIMYRKKDSKYSEDESLEAAELYKDILTCDVYHSALSKLSEINNALETLFPNLYQKGNGKVKKASKQSGLSHFGWMESISVVAEKGILNIAGITPFDSVKQTNLYTVMTHLSKMRASTEFERIYRENNTK
tara:strand:+ start:1233 stop:2171 length:939 start_codon:yes stop_codon:yes gene_type:complete